MKKILLSTITFLCVGLAFGQISFSDDFESYNDGDLVGAASPTWATWGGAGGGADDAPISTEQAASGTKSLKLFSTVTTGGPADVILPFGGKHTEGLFEFSTNIYVASPTAGYFNFQGEVAVGQTWSANFFFLPDGTISITNSANGVLLTSEYEQDRWFNFRVSANLTTNIWTIYVDDESVGFFSNTNNFVASLDLFPLNSAGSSLFYVDDVSFSHDPSYELPQFDAALGTVTSRNIGLTGDEFDLSGEVKNVGLDTITSFTIEWTDGINTFSEDMTGLNIPSLETAAFVHPIPYPLVDGNQQIEMSVTNINGNMDDGDPSNNVRTLSMTGYTPADGRKMFVEEATGTWCTWCPRGAVYMELMENRYPDHFIGVAVHNRVTDPMLVPEYDAGITNFPGFTGFPGVIIERNQVQDPLDIEANMLPFVTVPSPANIALGAEYDSNTRELNVSITAEFTEDVTGDFRPNVMIAENHVTGTTSGYNQINAYAGGGQGPMGGYENLPNPVPAAQMVYNQVARAILGGFNGIQNAWPEDKTTGTSYSWNFSYTIPADYEYEEMFIVGTLLGPNGSIANAQSNTIDEAVANGFVTSAKEVFHHDLVDVHPNPARDFILLQTNLSETTDVLVDIFDGLGQKVISKSYDGLLGLNHLSINTQALSPGWYSAHLRIGNQLATKKILIQ